MFRPEKVWSPSASTVPGAQPASPAPAAGFRPPPEGFVPGPGATPTIGSARFIPGRPGRAPLWAIFLVSAAILTPGIIRLSRRSGSVIEDSPAFINALEQWFPFLATGAEMTPRSVKRFVNRVRYFAMMEGSFQPARRWSERLAHFSGRL